MSIKILTLLGAVAITSCADGTLPIIEAPTNGVLTGYSVVQGSQEICKNPNVWVQFRGPESYISCPKDAPDPNFPGLSVSLPEFGKLDGYIVTDASGEEICEGPTVMKNANIISCTIN